MLQSLRGSKLPHRLFTALYRRTSALLMHCFKHPVKTLIFIVKAYLLLMLFCFFLVFSVGSFAQESNLCPDGGTFQQHPDHGAICSTPAPIGQSSFAYGNKGEYFVGRWPNPAQSALNTYNATTTGKQGGLNWTSVDKVINPNIPTTPSSFQITIERTYTYASNPPSVSTFSAQVSAGSLPPAKYCPPDSFPELVNLGGDEPNRFCWKAAVTPPCDCSELNGEGSLTSQTFIADNGVYSQENPPQCLNIRDSFDPSVPECRCQIVATKWFSQIANINGVEKTRWQPLPTKEQNGQSGIFTGTACGTEEDTAPPPEKEDCFVMKNGQKMCLAEKKNKCIVLDGIEQCEAGCGTKNGEFVCYEDDTPAIDPNEPLPEPEDDVTDPNKTTDQMTKQDHKDVNKGVESRLDLLAKLMEINNAKATSGGAANGAKIDSTNRLLGEINGKLGELVSQGDGEGEGDGDGEGEGDSNPQPDYSTDALEEFVNPNDWEARNFGTVLQAATQRMQQAPMFTSVETFFDVSITGTCPTWQASVPLFGSSLDINIDQMCSPTMTQIWPMIKAIILLGFSVMAFRAAVL